MRVLAIESSAMFGGVALVDRSLGLMAETRMSVKASYSERLMVEIDNMLRGAGTTVDDLDAIGISIGPGSFTGLRVGLGTAKGLAFATGLPLVPVPTLEAFALRMAMSAHPIAPMLDARRGEVYTALFGPSDGRLRRMSGADRVIRAEEFARGLREHGKVVFMGSGAKKYRNEITGAIGPSNAIFAPDEFMDPSAASVGALALDMLEDGFKADAMSVAPVYIRKSEAELKQG